MNKRNQPALPGTGRAEKPTQPGYSEHLAQMDSLLNLLASHKGTTADIARLQVLARAGQTDSEMEV